MHVYPIDAKTKEGNDFWSPPKRPPAPLVFDKDNLMHCSFIASLACLRAKMFFIEIPAENPRTEEFRRYCGELASQVKVKDFVPNEEKAKEIQNTVSKADKKENEEEEKEEEKKVEEEEGEVNIDDMTKQKDEFLQLFKSLPIDKKKNFEEYLVLSQEFEKDDDKNFHIDFMHSMGNCRAVNYNLKIMDWVTVKLKAGRIVPALATTTACVAGLQTLELVKIVMKAKKEDHRNIFLNLAVPFLQASEPADVMKEQLVEGLEVSLWDRWEMTGNTDTTIADVITHFEDTYKGLEVRDILRGNMPIFFYAIMNAQGKEKEKEKVLSTSVHSATESYPDDKYVDLNITCVRKDDQEAKILNGVPPLRVSFKQQPQSESK